MALDSHDFRLRIFEALRASPNSQWQNFLQCALPEALGRPPTNEEKEVAREVFHELMTANIIMAGSDATNSHWPFFSLTRYGRTVLASNGPPVHDYDGYLADLKTRVNDLDPTVEQYLSEALHAYHRTLPFASMVMLGCASERLVRLLMESYLGSLTPGAAQQRLSQKLNKRDISEAFKGFCESFFSTRGQVHEPHLGNDFELHVEGVFTFIRLLRNSITHPQGLPVITSAVVYSNLQQFSHYSATIGHLIAWYNSNPTRA